MTNDLQCIFRGQAPKSGLAWMTWSHDRLRAISPIILIQGSSDIYQIDKGYHPYSG